MFGGRFKTSRVNSINEGYKDTKGNGSLSRRSQSEDQPMLAFGGTTSSQATMLSPLESVFTNIIILEPLNPIFQRRKRKFRVELWLVRITSRKGQS